MSLDHDQEINRLLEMMDEAHKLPYSADDTIHAWREIIDLSDQLAEANAEYLEENLSLRNEFSKRLFDGQRYDEAAECDERIVLKLNSKSDAPLDVIWQGIRERQTWLRESILGADASYTYEPARTKTSAYPGQASSTSTSRYRQSKNELRPNLPEAEKPPSPWAKPRRVFSYNKVFQPTADPISRSSKDIPPILKPIQVRSYTVSNIESHDSQQDDSIAPVSDTVRRATEPARTAPDYLCENTAMSNTQ